MLPLDQWTPYPPHAERPASWPSALPFLPDRAARISDSKVGIAVMWVVSSRALSGEEVAERGALRESVMSGGAGGFFTAMRTAFSLMTGAPESENAASLDELLEQLHEELVSGGADLQAPGAAPQRTLGFGTRLYKRGAEEIAVTVTPRGPEVGVMLFQIAGARSHSQTGAKPSMANATMIEVPPQEHEPKEWPAGIPFVAHQLATVAAYEGSEARVVTWPIADGVSKTDPEARAARAEMDLFGAPERFFGAMQKMVEVLGRPANSPEAVRVRELLEQVETLALASGYERQNLNVPQMLPFLEQRFYARGKTSLMVNTLTGGDQLGVMAMVRELTDAA